MDGLLAGKLGVTEAASALQIAVRFPDDGGAALTATGTVAGATLSSTGAVSGSSLSITGAASVGLLSSATGITGSTLTINNTANAGNFTTAGDVSTGTLTASGAATAASFAATRAVTGATLTITGAASAGPLDCESLDCTFTATSGGVSTGSVVCGDVTSSGTVSAPQLFASNTLTVTNTSDFSDHLFLTKNWAGWSKLQVSNDSAAPDSGPELRLLGNQSARVFLERDGGAHQCELIMINNEALVQTKSLSTQLSLTTNQRNPACLVIAGNTGNVVCNTSFTNLSDSRVKTEMAEADVAELQQLFDSVEAKQYKCNEDPSQHGGEKLWQPVLNLVVFVELLNIMKQLGASDAHGNFCDLLLLNVKKQAAMPVSRHPQVAAVKEIHLAALSSEARN